MRFQKAKGRPSGADAPCGWIRFPPGSPTPTGAAAIWLRDAEPAFTGSLSIPALISGDNGRASIYPEISITFTCAGEAHYHLPLLLSDNSYTTYRGS